MRNILKVQSPSRAIVPYGPYPRASLSAAGDAPVGAQQCPSAGVDLWLTWQGFSGPRTAAAMTCAGRTKLLVALLINPLGFAPQNSER